MTAIVVPLVWSCSDRHVREIPLEEFFRNSEVRSYDISPDGKYLSYMAPYESRMNIFVQQAGSDSARRITSETDRDIAGYFWANNDRLLYLKDTGGDENYQLYGVNLDGSDPKAYTAIPGVRTQIIDPLEEIDSLIIVSTNQRDPQIFDPYRLNLNTGEMTLLAENPGNIQGWMTDHDGKLRVAYAIVDGVNTQILYRETEQEPFRPVLTTSFKDEVSFYVFTPDNKMVYATSNIGRDKAALVVVDPATGQEVEELYANDLYDVIGLGYSKAKEKLTGAYCEGPKDVIRHFFDPQTEESFRKLQAQLSGYQVSTTATNKAEDMKIVYAGNDRTRGTYYLYDVKADKLTKIADLAPWIQAEEMAEMIPVSYPSRDGLTIEGYLTLPAGLTMETARQLPVVVNPHGGPWARDSWGYNPEVQFLANRGYAVLQMNFRGSTGYGRKFKELSYKQWGQTMQNDITDGVRWLISQGIADSTRIAIYGGSYGGYMTNYMATHSKRFKAYVTQRSISNELIAYANSDMQGQSTDYKSYEDFMVDKLKESAVSYAERVDKPILILHGTQDYRTPIEGAHQFYVAIKDLHPDLPVKMVIYPHTGHEQPSDPRLLKHYYHEMAEWFKRYL